MKQFSFLSILILLASSVSSSALAKCDDLLSELSRQTIQENQFNTGRTLGIYKDELSDHFHNFLLNLRGHQVWIDAGAGEAKAVREYHAQVKSEDARAYTLAIGYVAPQSQKYQDFLVQAAKHKKFKYLSGRFLEEIPLKDLPSAALISDVYGPFHYSDRLDVVLEKYLSTLKKGGELYIKTIEGFRILEDSAGNEVSFNDYFSSISGVQAIRLGRSNFRIIKTSDKVTGIRRAQYIGSRGEDLRTRVYRVE